MRSIRAVVVAVLLALPVLVLTACGSSGAKVASNNPFDTGGVQSPKEQPLTGGKRGGVLNVLNETDFEHIDPGLAYYNIDYEVVFATQRPLYSNKPNTYTEKSPDMAVSQPEMAPDAQPVTVDLRESVQL